MARFIGIRHRVKRTSQNEERPTMIAVHSGDQRVVYTLEDDTAELDFLKGQFPTKFRAAKAGEDLSQYPAHHRIERKKKDSEEKVTLVPESYDGLSAGDTVGMVLGGSGDRLAYALSRRGEIIGAEVYRIPPFLVAQERGDKSKDEDHLLLATLVFERRDLFYAVGSRDRDLIRLQEAHIWRREAQQARIACEQRLYQRAIGRIFLSEDGQYPEGTVSDQYDALRASDRILLGLSEEEKRRDAELRAIARKLDVWEKLFSSIEGCGEVIAAGIIAAVADIRRFQVTPDLSGDLTPEEANRRRSRAVQKGAAKLKAFCGVHVLPDGKFPRQRSGSVANWSPKARQALYLLADQFNRRPDSVWGTKLLEYKRILRQRHPEPIEVAGKKRYTKGHIHKQAIWRTLTKFVEWLYREWNKLETEREAAELAA